MGTVPYMSPEQLNGEALYHRTDLFSLGIMLYEMAAGQRPFKGRTSATITSSILRDTPRPLHELNSVMPRHLGRIIEHCLKKNPEERFQSAKDVRNELRELRNEVDSGSDYTEPVPVITSASQPPSSTSSSPSGSAMSRPARRGELWIGVGVIAVVIVFVELWIGRGDAPDKELATSQTPTSDKQQQVATRLAILPFTDNSPEPQEWLASGLADAISTRLGRVNPSKLGVIGPETTTYYTQPGKSIQDLREDLNVAFVLSASIQEIGNVVRITAKLMQADGLTPIWSDEFKGTLDDPFALQSMVAEKIMAGLPLELTGDERARLKNRYTANPEAERAYMKGRVFAWAQGVQKLSQAIKYFEQAIKIDSNYALAYCGLVDANCMLAAWGTLRTSQIRGEMGVNVAKALALDDTLAEAHVSAGLVATYLNWDWPAAEEEFKRAIQLNPNLASVYEEYGFLLKFVGRYDEAIRQYEQAIDLNPVSAHYLSSLGMLYASLGRLSEAESLLLEAFELNTDDSGASAWLADVRQKQGRFPEAVKIMERSVSSTEHPEVARLCFLGNAYAMDGRMDDARKQLTEMDRLKGDLPDHHMWFGEMHAALGDKDEAFRRLDQALAAREAWLPHIRFHPGFIHIRSDSRFAELHRKMGLPDDVLSVPAIER